MNIERGPWLRGDTIQGEGILGKPGQPKSPESPFKKISPEEEDKKAKALAKWMARTTEKKAEAEAIKFKDGDAVDVDGQKWFIDSIGEDGIALLRRGERPVTPEEMEEETGIWLQKPLNELHRWVEKKDLPK